MCGSNRPGPTPLPGKTGDITFLATKIGDNPRGRAILFSDNPWVGQTLLVIIPGRGEHIVSDNPWGGVNIVSLPHPRDYH